MVFQEKMEEQIRLEAYYTHLRYPEQSDVENWLMAEKSVLEKNKKERLQQFYERYRVVYTKKVLDTTKLKDCPASRDDIILIFHKNKICNPNKNIHKYCVCKNMNQFIKPLIR